MDESTYMRTRIFQGHADIMWQELKGKLMAFSHCVSHSETDLEKSDDIWRDVDKLVKEFIENIDEKMF